MAVKRVAVRNGGNDADGFDRAVAEAVEVFRRGGTVVFPTETVYGVGVVHGDLPALERLRVLKGRRSGKPFQLLAGGLDMAEGVGAVFDGRALRLAAAFWPGPLTLVVPGGGDDPVGVGVRVPDSPFILAVCRELDRPIVSSSANPPGAPPPADAVAADAFGGAVDLLVDGGPVAVGVPSTVVRCGADGYEILRPGAIGDDALAAAWNGSRRLNGRF